MSHPQHLPGLLPPPLISPTAHVTSTHQTTLFHHQQQQQQRAISSRKPSASASRESSAPYISPRKQQHANQDFPAYSNLHATSPAQTSRGFTIVPSIPSSSVRTSPAAVSRNLPSTLCSSLTSVSSFPTSTNSLQPYHQSLSSSSSSSLSLSPPSSASSSLTSANTTSSTEKSNDFYNTCYYYNNTSSAQSNNHWSSQMPTDILPRTDDRHSGMHTETDSLNDSISHSSQDSYQLNTDDANFIDMDKARYIYDINEGKLPGISDLTHQLWHNVSGDIFLDLPQGRGSYESLSTSRSSSCSSGFEEDDSHELTELYPFGFFDGENPMIESFLMKEEPMDDSVLMNITSEFSDSEGYDSSHDQPGCSILPSQGYYPEQYPESYSQLTGFVSTSAPSWNRQSSPESDEGFVDEPSSAPENLPNFEKIQYPSTEPEPRQPSRRASASPKERRKANDSPQIADKERRKPGRKPGQVSNVLHLWEFMRDLLHSPDSKGIIEWISKPEGVFRVVNSTEVAKLWGKKKKNKKEMTYEKLSRSLRYSRLEGYFSNLPKDKNYPKKLCFKFGPKSKDWH